MPKRETNWGEYWHKRATAHDMLIGIAKMVVITRNDSRLQIACPYDPLFVALAHGAGATWRYKSKLWSFPSGQWIAGLQAVEKCFGRGKLTPDWLHYMDTENAKQTS